MPALQWSWPAANCRLGAMAVDLKPAIPGTPLNRGLAVGCRMAGPPNFLADNHKTKPGAGRLCKDRKVTPLKQVTRIFLKLAASVAAFCVAALLVARVYEVTSGTTNHPSILSLVILAITTPALLAIWDVPLREFLGVD